MIQGVAAVLFVACLWVFLLAGAYAQVAYAHLKLDLKYAAAKARYATQRENYRFALAAWQAGGRKGPAPPAPVMPTKWELHRCRN